MAKTTYHGSCYCGKTRFEADIDLTQSATGRCNCTSCRKRRWWSVQIAPDDFRLLTNEGLSLVIPTRGGTTLHLCPDCGVLLYGRKPAREWNDGAKVAVSVAALDDLEPETLIAAPAKYYDGLHDNWWHPPAEVRHL